MKKDGVLLAGGKSRRMGGLHKGGLLIGDERFSEHILGVLSEEAEQLYLSCGETNSPLEDKENGETVPLFRVYDRYPDCGPLGGLQASLFACKNDLLMAAACDMPFLEAELYRLLSDELKRAEEESGKPYDGAVPSENGRLHPLAAIYRKSAEPVFRAQLERGSFRLKEALSMLRILYVEVGTDARLCGMLRNINTPEEYRRITETEEAGSPKMRENTAEKRRESKWKA